MRNTKGNGVTLKCPHCGEIWEYRGNKKVFANCPDCRRAVNIEVSNVKDKK